MNKTITRNFFGFVSLLLAVLVFTATPVCSAEKRAGDTSHRFGGEKATYKSAIEKVGFYNGIIKERVTILDENSYRKLKYIVHSNMIVTYQEQEIEWQSLLPHSIVKLIIVDAEVVEIILLQESS